MITHARNVATLTSECEKIAQESASKCRDRQLCDRLLQDSQAAKNFATQLKIISAVKAATSFDDPTVKAQLYKNAKLIAASIIAVLKAESVAKILQKKA